MTATLLGTLALLATALMLYAMMIPRQVKAGAPFVSPITVAVIDSGINAEHNHFNGVPITVLDATIEYSTEGVTDTCLHGTPVAGMVVNQNPQVALLVIKATWQCYADYQAIIDGIHYAVEHGARVISISMGGEYDWFALHDAMIFARQNGVFVAASAGNSGDDDSPIYPAWYPEVAAVSAYDFKQSSYGPFVDLSAPGNRVYAPIGSKANYARLTGTSMSAPIVAGMASYIWQRQPDLTLWEMERILYGSLRDVDPAGYDIYTGWGAVDERALHRALGEMYVDLPWLMTGRAGANAAVIEDMAVELIPIRRVEGR